MNGVAKVTIKGQEYPIKFGVQALMLYEARANKSLVTDDENSNVITASVNVFYAGLVGACIRLELPMKSFSDACDLFDELALEETYNEQLAEIWEAFNASVLPIITARNPQPAEENIAIPLAICSYLIKTAF